MENASDATSLLDSLAIVDLVNRYVDDADAKRWDRVTEFFTEDAVMSWGPEQSLQGRSAIVDTMRQALDDDQVVALHQIGSFAPHVDGDTAEARIRMRGMHYGFDPRKPPGSFADVLGVLETRFVRTNDGWRCSYYEWQMAVTLGSAGIWENIGTKTGLT